MKKIHLLVPLVAIALLGCHKNVPVAPPAPAETAAPAADAGAADAGAAGVQPVQPVMAPSPSVAASANNLVQGAITGEVDEFLTSQLQIFIQQKGRMPTSFMELAHTRLDSIPRPPEGKKWAIDGTTGQVKAVSQ